jgi:hypothetical protein
MTVNNNKNVFFINIPPSEAAGVPQPPRLLFLFRSYYVARLTVLTNGQSLEIRRLS